MCQCVCVCVCVYVCVCVCVCVYVCVCSCVCVTGVSVCMSLLGSITHSLCICHLAIKLYCIVLYCVCVCVCAHVVHIICLHQCDESNQYLYWEARLTSTSIVTMVNSDWFHSQYPYEPWFNFPVSHWHKDWCTKLVPEKQIWMLLNSTLDIRCSSTRMTMAYNWLLVSNQSSRSRRGDRMTMHLL